MKPACPICGPRPLAHGGGPCLASGLVLALIGGLALVAAFFMPWFGTQGIVLTGQFLNRFLSGPGDLSRFIPGSSGGQGEVQLLRALVLLFPACGLLATALALLAALQPGLLRRPVRVVLALSGLVPLVALVLGVSRLPAGASYEVGLLLIGAGALAVLLGVSLDTFLPVRVAATGVEQHRRTGS